MLEHDQSKFPTDQVLLMPDVLVGRNHHIEPRRFYHFEKVAVLKLRMPPHVDESARLMLG